MTSKPDAVTPLKILVAGGSGFIGSRLIKKLSADIRHRVPQFRAEILCLTRDPQSIKDMFAEDVRLVKADVSNYEDLTRVMSEQIDIAYYLVHSMEGASKKWKKFSERDRVAAMNFAKVATEYGVKRIIYLGGLIRAEDNQYNKLSEHMRSRKEVGEILEQQSSSKVTTFRAAVILGQGRGFISNAPISSGKTSCHDLSKVGAYQVPANSCGRRSRVPCQVYRGGRNRGKKV